LDLGRAEDLNPCKCLGVEQNCSLPASVFEGGDHAIILGEVETTRAESGAPLLYYRGGYAQLEH